MLKRQIGLSVFLLLLLFINKIEATIEWKIKPNETYTANEYDNVQLNCEFSFNNNENEINGNSDKKYFVIWYKNGVTISLNDQLANLQDSNHYKIVGQYNLIVFNVTKNDSGLYTCQLFQSMNMKATVNLTVLVPAKYAKINLINDNSEELVEGNKLKLNCCTNNDISPFGVFKWYKINNNKQQDEQQQQLIEINNNDYDSSIYINDDDTNGGAGHLCNQLTINLSKNDNDYEYKCFVSNNKQLTNALSDKVQLTVEYKPIVSVTVNGLNEHKNEVTVIENKSIELYCNVNAKPNVYLTYQWYFNGQLLSDINDNYLNLNNININQTGYYSCKCANKHGYDQSDIYINVLYTHIDHLNKSVNYNYQNNNNNNKIIELNTYNNATSVVFGCLIQSNPSITSQNVTWWYYLANPNNNRPVQITSSIINNQKYSIESIYDDNNKTISYLSINNVSLSNTGYYKCSVNSNLIDSINNNLKLALDLTYYLRVQFAPIINVNKRKLFTNVNDNVKLTCEIKSNPEAIYTWYHDNNEIFVNYKYNITNTINKQIKQNLNEPDNNQLITSTLTINSLNQYDFGNYACKASNLIGDSVQVVSVERTRVPDVPTNISITNQTSNSLYLNWFSGYNGGSNQTYLLTINSTINLTIVDDYNQNDSSNELKQKSIEIKGLDLFKTYEFRLLSFNKYGQSEYGMPITAFIRPKTNQYFHDRHVHSLPNMIKAQYNDNSEELCFELSQSTLNLNDYTLKLNIFTPNNDDSTSTAAIKFDSINNNNKLNQSKFSLYQTQKLNYGKNCISYTSIFNKTLKQRDEQERLMSRVFGKFYLSSPVSFKIMSKTKNFQEFKQNTRINMSLCFINDSSICTQDIQVTDNYPDISTYFTLIIIGTSVLFVFVTLVIVSICCCCCCRNNKNKMECKSKLVVKTLPLQCNGNSIQPKNFDCSPSDTSSKLSHIEGHNYIQQQDCIDHHNNNAQKLSYLNETANLYFNPPSSASTTEEHNKYSVTQQNTSSSIIVESDVISSSSSSTSDREHNTKTIQSGYYSTNTLSISKQALFPINKTNSSSNSSTSSNSHNKKTPPYFLTTITTANNNSGSIPVSTIQQQKHINNNNINMNNTSQHDSPESGYSTPTNHYNKKLFYEVIV